MVHAVGLTVALFATWLLLSGHYVALLLSLGGASCLAVVAIVLRMDVVDHEGQPLHLGWRLLTYLPWLLWQIVLANLDVARRIVNPRLPISPTLVKIKASQASELGQVIYANSITLTPGTVSMELENAEITVHAISRDGAADLEGGEMDRRVSRLEGGP